MIDGNGNPNGDIAEGDGERSSVLDIAWATTKLVLRIGVILAIWLTIQLGVFLGFFTVPLLILMVFSLAWFGLDLWNNYPKMFARWRDRKRARKQ